MKILLARPNNPVLKCLKWFYSQIFVATPNEAPLDQNQDTMRFAFAQDANLNHRPDEDTPIGLKVNDKSMKKRMEWTASLINML